VKNFENKNSVLKTYNVYDKTYLTPKNSENITCINDKNSEYNFKNWKLGSINIRTGGEKSVGGKMYMVTKEVAKAGLSMCLLQEVRYKNNGRRYWAIQSILEKNMNLYGMVLKSNASFE